VLRAAAADAAAAGAGEREPSRSHSEADAKEAEVPAAEGAFMRAGAGAAGEIGEQSVEYSNQLSTANLFIGHLLRYAKEVSERRWHTAMPIAGSSDDILGHQSASRR
jgi:hypothetical protein